VPVHIASCFNLQHSSLMDCWQKEAVDSGTSKCRMLCNFWSWKSVETKEQNVAIDCFALFFRIFEILLSSFCPKDRLFWFLLVVFCSPSGKFLVVVMKYVVTLPPIPPYFPVLQAQTFFLSTLFNLCLSNPYFTPVHFTPFCYNAPCYFTQLLNFRALVFCLTPLGWLHAWPLLWEGI